MKKIFLGVSIIFTTASLSFAQRNDIKQVNMEETSTRKELRKERRIENRNEVSYLTKSQFAIDFPHAGNVRFVKTKEFEEVAFMVHKKNLRAYYDYDSKLVGTTQRKSFADLPENAQKEILKKYPGYTVQGVIQFDDNEDNDTDMILYETSFDDADNYFVELKNQSKALLVKVDLSGETSFFKDIK